MINDTAQWFDKTTYKSIVNFKDEVDKLIPDIIENCMDDDDEEKDLYGSKICDIIEKGFEFTVDFRAFYVRWLNLPIKNLPGFGSNSMSWKSFFEKYRAENNAVEILDLIVNRLRIEDTITSNLESLDQDRE